MAEEIPRVPGLPFIGNLRDINPEVPIESLSNLADTYGPIYKFSVFGNETIVVSSVDLVAELCDEKRFEKSVARALNEVRNGTHDGLFTAYPGEKNWEVAHRVLVPAFGPLNIRSMFDDMKDIGSQLVMKWARHGSDYKIPVTDDFTRLTLDTLALCSMDYRFNSFYQEQMHPFVDAMVGFLGESGARTRRPGLLGAFFRREEYQYWKDIEYMRTLSRELVQNRRDHDIEKKDLLSAMIHGKDPRTGDSLNEDSIIDNMITFLIAGHETTSGMLSFVFYRLLKNPAALQKAQEEVDRVVGKGTIQAEHMSKLPYITAILRETLRLTPTAPAFSITAKGESEVLGGRYHVKKGENIVVVLPKVHLDPAVYGDDAKEWKPERMLDENFNKLPPSAWKPFGNGVRACIGRPFAWQEALLVTAMLVQYFDFSMNDPSYTLQIKSTLTIKPKDFFMHAKLRNGVTATQLERALSGSMSGPKEDHAHDQKAAASRSSKPGKPMTVLYGSNTGTCQAFAQRLAADAPARGFTAKVDSLDSAKGGLPADQPVVLISASYEGAPCDNGTQFQAWLESLKNGDDTKVSYAVFGAGHSDWKQTFHKIPTAIDNILADHKGERICKRGTADAAHGDMFSDFESWSDQELWPAMAKKYGATEPSDLAQSAQGITVEVSNVRSSHLRADVYEARVIEAKTLTAAGVPEKRHIEIQLPSDMTYSSGDYLAILPVNPQESVQRVMRHFNLAWDSMLTISASAGTILPTNIPISANDLFGAYVELSQPATKRNVSMLADACKDGATKSKLTSLASDLFPSEISEKRISLLDLLTKYPDIPLPLSHFIAALPPMRTRSYSISSSPLWNAHNVTLTYSVLSQPHVSGAGRYVGVASHYLSQLSAGDTLHVSVRPSNQAFHLPTDTENTPVIMIAAGTGLAPFRGFVQERAAQVGAGRKLAPAMLFLGCRDPEMDELYREELSRWEAMGAVQVVRAYSQNAEKGSGARYAQDALYQERKKVVELWEKGARVYVCGSRALEVGVSGVFKKLYVERVKEVADKEIGEEKAEEWLAGIRNVRFATDVFT